MEYYFDHHSTSSVDPIVFECAKSFFLEHWGSYIQPHSKGQGLIEPIRQAYRQIYQLLNISDQETLILTSNGAEAITQVFESVYQKVVRETGKNHFITLSYEDAPILMNMQHLEDRGCSMTSVQPTVEDIFPTKEILEAINPRTAMISISWASGLLGVIQPVEELKEACSKRGILLHLDISYAVGKIDIDPKDLAADYLTFSADKLHALKSAGVLYCKQKAPITSLIIGGLEQDNLRAGPLDTAQVVAFGKACEIAKQQLMQVGLEVARLRDLFEDVIRKEISEVEVLFKGQPRLPNVSVISFKKVSADSLLYALNKRGLYATLGGGSFQKLSYLLENMKEDPLTALGAISFAFSRFTTQEEIIKGAEIIISEVKKIQKLSKDIEVIGGSIKTY